MKQISNIQKRLASMGKQLKNRWKTVAIVVVLLLGVGFYLMQKQQQTKVELVTTTPVRKSLIKTLDVSGIVDAKEKARLRFLSGGKVTYLGAKEGDTVKKWQTLAVIDQATLEKQLQQNLNNYMKERWDWEQFRDDSVENGDGSQRIDLSLADRRTVDQAQWDLENSVLTVEVNSIAIQNTRMTTPIDGVLISAPTSVAGTQLTAADAFDVVNPETLIFKAAVDEVDIATVKEGQTAEIELDAYPDTFIRATISYISLSSSQSSTGTVFVIELPLPQDGRGLGYYRLGMNGDVAIQIDQKEDALVIPIEATRETDGKTFVDVEVAPGKSEERQITTGLETDEEIEVLSGLTEQDLVILPS